MIVIEGPDNVGKTTFAKKLCELTGLQYSHMSRPGPGFNWFTDYKKILKPGHVMDRAHLGGIVYHKQVVSSDARFLKSWVEAQGGLLVVICPKHEQDYRERCLHSDKPEMFTEEERLMYYHNWNDLRDEGYHSLWLNEIREELVSWVGVVATFWQAQQDLCKEWNDAVVE